MNLVTINDGKELAVTLLDYGARIAGIEFVGRPVALAYSAPESYRTDPFYLGATVGPICNRIAGASLDIAGERFDLPANEGPNCLHSGGRGFDQKPWSLLRKTPHSADYKLIYDLAEIGMRGELECLAHYSVANGALNLVYEYQCSHTTYANITNHVYFNLNGDQTPIDNHQFELHADSFLNVDADSIPNGETTKLDRPFRYQVGYSGELSELSGFCDRHFNADGERLVTVVSPASGISLEVTSNAPGFQFYTGKFLSKPFAEAAGFCVEPQYPPDAINQPNLHAPLLMAGNTSSRSTTYRFSTV